MVSAMPRVCVNNHRSESLGTHSPWVVCIGEPRVLFVVPLPTSIVMLVDFIVKHCNGAVQFLKCVSMIDVFKTVA